MKYLYYTLFASLFLFCCCDKDSINSPDEKEEYHLIADIEAVYDGQTRSAVGNDGCFEWTNDDVIGICGYNSINNRFHYVGGGGSDNEFAGVFDLLSDRIRFGYYPYRSDISIKDDSLNFTIEETSVFRNNVNDAPMIGFLDSDNIMTFKQAGGLLKLSFRGLSNQMKFVAVESAGNSRQYLSGNAVLAINPDENETFRITAGSYKRMFDMSSVDKDTTVLDLYVPFQTGEYSTVKVFIIDENGDTVSSNSLSDVTIGRAGLITAPLLVFSD